LRSTSGKGIFFINSTLISYPHLTTLLKGPLRQLIIWYYFLNKH
jgi:hypothetical protein